MRSLSPLFALLTLTSLLGCGEKDATDDSAPTDDSAAAQSFTACEGSFTLETPNPSYPWTPNAIQLVSEELKPGVFVVYDETAPTSGPAGYPLATSGGFVIGDDGVLLVETMINRQLFCQLIDLVQAQTDKPVLYAVNTSHHGDHSYGNAFLPEEVQVVQHARTAAFIAAHFAEDVAFMEANFGADQGIDEVTAVAADVEVSDAGWSVDLGGVTVEANYQGFGQTDGDLFVYVPEARVLWTGNPVIARAPAIPWLLEGHAHEVETTLSDLRDSLPADVIVVPGHDQHQSLEVFDFSVDYLETLQAEVQASVDAGLSVEETVSAVSMEPYQGYALWGWVHSVVNVPATYGELGG